MIYILLSVGGPGKVQITPYDGNRDGTREVSIQEKIDTNLFINLINKYKIIDKTQYRHNFRIIPTLINIYKHKDNIKRILEI